MQESTNIELKKNFHKEMITLYKRIRKEIKYTPPQLFEMISKYGGFDAALKFILTDANTFLFTLLWEQQRLDLSIEVLVVKESYKNLFSDEIIAFCQKRLEAYHYIPKQIAPPETSDAESTLVAKEDVSVKQEQDQSLEEEGMPNKHTLYTAQALLSKENWKMLLRSSTLFSDKNKDLLIRMYLMGGKYITPQILEAEEGYTLKYPYKEVIATLAKRIKATFKIELPLDQQGKLLPWHLLFIGWFENNQNFSWCLRPELYDALGELIQSNYLETSHITIQTEPSKLLNTDNYFQFESLVEPEEMLNKKEEVVEQENNEQLIPPLDASSVDFESFDEAPIEALDFDDFDFAQEDYKNIDTHLYGPADDHEPKYKREPLAEMSLDDLIDSIFDTESPKIKKAAKEEKKQEKPIVSKNIIKPVITRETIKTSCIEYYGAVCELCGFDFGYTYGEAFEKLIDIYPLDGKDIESRLDTLDPQKDVIPICSNCKTVITSKSPAYTVEEIKKVIK